VFSLVQFYVTGIVLTSLHTDRLEVSSRLLYGSAAQHWYSFVAARPTLAGDVFMDAFTEEEKSTFAFLSADYCFQCYFHMESSFAAMRHLFNVNQNNSVDFMTDNAHVTYARVSVWKRIVSMQREKSRQDGIGYWLGVPKQAPATYDMIKDVRN